MATANLGVVLARAVVSTGVRAAKRRRGRARGTLGTVAKPEISELLELPIGERVKLVQVLWDSIAEMPDPYPLSERERRLIDERLAAYRKNPEAGSSWSEVKERILGRK